MGSTTKVTQNYQKKDLLGAAIVSSGKRANKTKESQPAETDGYLLPSLTSDVDMV